MTTTTMVRVLAIGAAAALWLPRGARAWEVTPVGPQSCHADGLAQFECGNPQTLPDCEVTCFGRATCTDAKCTTIYYQGPDGPTDEIVTQFYLAPVCACVGGWTRLDTIRQLACVGDLMKRTDQHRSRVAQALTRCETAVLGGRLTLASGTTCSDEPRTAQAIASSRERTAQALAVKCSAEVLTAVYGTDGPASAASFVDGLLRHAEANAAADIALAVRTAVMAP